MAFRSHPDKNKHPQDSAVMCMINEAEERLEELFRYNNVMREQDEDLQRQEKSWREDKRIRKVQ